jgi:hypothetical protein
MRRQKEAEGLQVSMNDPNFEMMVKRVLVQNNNFVVTNPNPAIRQSVPEKLKVQHFIKG